VPIVLPDTGGEVLLGRVSFDFEADEVGFSHHHGGGEKHIVHSES